ncbi:hypothetical protein GCM10020370_71080 [Paenibacillus hodogayensis]
MLKMVSLAPIKQICKPRVGLYSFGLRAYWGQFPGTREVSLTTVGLSNYLGAYGSEGATAPLGSKDAGEKRLYALLRRIESIGAYGT